MENIRKVKITYNTPKSTYKMTKGYYNPPEEVPESVELEKESAETNFKVLKKNQNVYMSEGYTKNKKEELQKNGINYLDYCNKSFPGISKYLLGNYFFVYLRNIELSARYQNCTLQDKCDIAGKVMEYDLNHDKEILYKTPVLKKGKVDSKITESKSLLSKNTYTYEGEYLQYFNESGIEVIAPLQEITTTENGEIISKNSLYGNDKQRYIEKINNYYFTIMKQSQKFTQKFKEQTSQNLKTIFMAPFTNKDKIGPTDGWLAYITQNEFELNQVSSNMIIDTNQLTNENINKYHYMVNGYIHELGHVFANASDGQLFSNEIDMDEYWVNIYNQIKTYAGDNGPLKEYAATNSREAFAECVAEYFGEGEYNTNNLKAIDVIDPETGEKTTLYDVMDKILN